MQLCDLGSHLYTKLCIKVGQRLVHKEYLRITNYGASQRNTLSLSAGKSLRLAVEIILNAQYLRCILNLLVNVGFMYLAQLQAERHVIINRHMRIKCIVLEYHRNISFLGRYIVHQLVADIKLTLGNFFKTGHHAQRSGFSAAGRTDQNDEFLILNHQIEIVNGGYSTGVDLINMSQCNVCHNSLLEFFFILHHNNIIYCEFAPLSFCTNSSVL